MTHSTVVSGLAQVFLAIGVTVFSSKKATLILQTLPNLNHNQVRSKILLSQKRTEPDTEAMPSTQRLLALIRQNRRLKLLKAFYIGYSFCYVPAKLERDRRVGLGLLKERQRIIEQSEGNRDDTRLLKDNKA